jgi:hypothetical protein
MVKENTDTADNPDTKVVLVPLEGKVLSQIGSDIANLLQSNWPTIYQAYRKAHIDSGEEDFTFGIGLGVKLHPEMHGVKVICKISYSVKYADETDPVIVSNQPDMFQK